MCVALAALDATVQVQGNGGARSIPMNDFIVCREARRRSTPI